MKASQPATGQAIGSRTLAMLLAVAETGSIRRAAAMLGVSPPAVSKAVREAEARLGGPLFQRSVTGMQPTEPGRRFLDDSRAGLASLLAAEQAFRARTGTLAGTVRIGAGPFPAPSVARLLVPEAARRWPAIRIQVSIGTASELLPGLVAGQHDLLICHVYDLALPPDVRSHRIQLLQSVVLVRAGHPLADGAPVAPHALAPYPLAGFPPYRRMIDWYRAQVGVEPDFAFFGGDSETVAEVVASSDMITITSRFIARDLAPRYGLVALPVSWAGLSHEVHLVVRVQRASPAVEAIAALAEERLTMIEAAGDL